MELEIVKFFNRLGRGTVVDFMTIFVSQEVFLGASWSLLAIIIFFLDKEIGLKVSIAMTVAVGLHFIITKGILKVFLGQYFKKARPCTEYFGEIIPLGKKRTDSAFPSSHMSANVALVSVIIYFYPTIWPVAIIWVLFMAFARMHNGMHYPSDIFGGIVLGVLYGMAGIYFGKISNFDFIGILI